MYSGLINIALVGNILALYNLLVGKGGLAMKRSKIIFLHITLADMLVTLFPVLGMEHSLKIVVSEEMGQQAREIQTQLLPHIFIKLQT